MRTHISALIALYARCGVPRRNGNGYAAFLVSRNSRRHRTVLNAHEYAHRQIISHLGIYRVCYFGYEFRRRRTLGLLYFESGIEFSPLCRHIHFDIFAAAVNGRIVLGNHVGSLLAVALFYEVLHLGHRLVVRYHVRYFEESGLEYRVCTASQTYLAGYLRGIDYVEIYLFLGQNVFYRVRQHGLCLFGIVKAVQKERSSFPYAAQHVVFVQIRHHMACHEIWSSHKIRRIYRIIAETQVRACKTARFFRVVCEICLAVFGSRFTDYLNRVFVCSDSTVGTQSVELGLKCGSVGQRYLFLHRKGKERNVINYTHRETVLRLRQFHVFIN